MDISTSSCIKINTNSLSTCTFFSSSKSILYSIILVGFYSSRFKLVPMPCNLTCLTEDLLKERIVSKIAVSTSVSCVAPMHCRRLPTVSIPNYTIYSVLHLLHQCSKSPPQPGSVLSLDVSLANCESFSVCCHTRYNHDNFRQIPQFGLRGATDTELQPTRLF